MYIVRIHYLWIKNLQLGLEFAPTLYLYEKMSYQWESDRSIQTEAYLNTVHHQNEDLNVSWIW